MSLQFATMKVALYFYEVVIKCEYFNAYNHS